MLRQFRVLGTRWQKGRGARPRKEQAPRGREPIVTYSASFSLPRSAFPVPQRTFTTLGEACGSENRRNRQGQRATEMRAVLWLLSSNYRRRCRFRVG